MVRGHPRPDKAGGPAPAAFRDRARAAPAVTAWRRGDGRPRRRAAVTPGPRRAVGILGLVLLVPASIPGCSTLELVWPYADRILVDRVEDWVDLRPEQRRRLRLRLDAWLEWMRRERLVPFAHYLRAAAERVEDGLGPEEVEWIYRRGDRLYRELAESALDWVVPTLTGLDPAQRRELRRRLRTDNAAFRRQYVTATPRQADRAFAEALIGRVERWTGRLSTRQRELTHGAVGRLSDVQVRWYRYRLRMQAGLLAALAADQPEPSVRVALERWWVHGAALGPADSVGFERSERRLLAIAVRLGATLSASQRARAARRLRGLADQLEAIATSPRAAASEARPGAPRSRAPARAAAALARGPAGHARPQGAIEPPAPSHTRPTSRDQGAPAVYT